jgi:hypothetical protein
MAMLQHKLAPMPFDHFLARQRRMVPFAAILLAGCHPALPPPPVDAAALRQAELVDFQTLRLPVSLLNTHATATDSCLDEQGREPGLEYDARMVWRWPSTRVAMRIGLYHPMEGWKLPGKPAMPVDAALEARLDGVSTTALLKLTSVEGRRQAHERTRQNRDRPKARPACVISYQLSVPTYSEGIAFIDRSYSCGALCGGGGTLAMEYRDRQWRLIAIRPSRMA